MNTTVTFLLVTLGCILQIFPVDCASEDLLLSWKQINKNYANDIQQSNNIYNRIKEEQRALAELRTIVERHLRTKNSEILANAISSNDVSLPKTKLKVIFKDISSTYDNQMVDSIFTEAINEIILMKPLPVMPDLLWRIYQQKDLELFEVMLRSQLQLYNSFSQKHNKDEKAFLQNFSYRLHKIKNENLYNNMDQSLKSSVENIIEQLPNNLRYLYFMPYFCLLNVKHSTYIYIAIQAKVDALSRYIWLWHDNKSMDGTGYIKAEVQEFDSTGRKKLKVLLKGTLYQMYYYIMPSTKMVAGWDTNTTSINNIWSVEFLDNDHVVFSQNDYIMCAAENHDNERQNVRGHIKGEVSSTNSECQWRLGECAFK